MQLELVVQISNYSERCTQSLQVILASNKLQIMNAHEKSVNYETRVEYISFKILHRHVLPAQIYTNGEKNMVV